LLDEIEAQQGAYRIRVANWGRKRSDVRGGSRFFRKGLVGDGRTIIRATSQTQRVGESSKCVFQAATGSTVRNQRGREGGVAEREELYVEGKKKKTRRG